MRNGRSFPTSCAIPLLAVLFLPGLPGPLLGNEANEAQEIDRIIKETPAAAAKTEQPQAGGETGQAKAEQKAAPAAEPQAAPETAAARTAPSSMTGDIASLVDALTLKEKQLGEAQKEIRRLKDLVKRILEANRRERVVMHYNMGCVYRYGKEFKRAEEEFLKALEIDASDAGVHYNLAILYDDDLKDKKKARQHYERFLELAPEDKDAAKVREWLSSIKMKIVEEK